MISKKKKLARTCGARVLGGSAPEPPFFFLIQLQYNILSYKNKPTSSNFFKGGWWVLTHSIPYMFLVQFYEMNNFNLPKKNFRTGFFENQDFFLNYRSIDLFKIVVEFILVF